jgi:biofilm PGA synthesis N-glycosyltransferase PgaC
VSIDSLATGLMLFVGLYPVVSSGLWIAGALVFKLSDERTELGQPRGGWPGVTVLIPAHNEEQVIATSVGAALASDYPELEVLVLDDGSEDGTAQVAEAAGAGDDRLRVIRDEVNLGKADRLNRGFELASHELVAVTDADAHLHPLALKLLVARISRSERLAAVAGAPHVTNRQNLLCALQVIEEASIVGLIRRTQAVGGRVGVVAGVLGLFRRDAVLGVGSFRREMATEDIELSVRLLLAGWLTSYEPRALVGVEVPADLRTLWAQRRRWARGQGEVMHEHGLAFLRWRNRRLWPLALEAVGSMVWVLLLGVATAVVTVAVVGGGGIALLLAGLSWGIGMAVVATLQMCFALGIDIGYDRRARLALLVGVLYPVAYWVLSAAAALRSELAALVRGPREDHVVWDIPSAPVAQVRR